MPVNKYSQIYKLSQYILPVDLGLMATVLQNKQQKYDANKESINQAYNSLLNLDVAKDSDRQYIAKKSNEVMNQINSMGAMNLSNNNIASQLTGLISSVGKDERISNALIQTKKIRAIQQQQQEINKLRLEGKDVKYNEITQYHDDKRVMDYLNDTDELSSVKGSNTITAWHDWRKESDELIKNIGLEFYANYKLVAGSDDLLMNLQTGEKVTKEKIHQTLIENISSQAKNAMKLESDYVYKNHTLEQLADEVDNQYVKEFIKGDTFISDLKSRLPLADLKEQKLILEQISDAEERLGSLNEQRRDAIKRTLSNLESSKYALFFDKSLNSISNAKQKNDVKKFEIELNQARVKKEEWAKDDYRLRLQKEDNDLARERFNLDKQNSVYDNEYKKAQTAKIMHEFSGSTGQLVQMNLDGTVSIMLSTSSNAMLAFSLGAGMEDKVDYGKSFSDEIKTNTDKISESYMKIAKKLLYEKTGITNLSLNTTSGFEVNLKNADKHKKYFTQEEFHLLTTYIKASNDAAIGKISNVIDLSDINSFNLIEGLKAKSDALYNKQQAIRRTSFQDALAEKGIRAKLESILFLSTLADSFERFNKKLLVIRNIFDDNSLDMGASTEEKINAFLKLNLKYNNDKNRKQLQIMIDNKILESAVSKAESLTEKANLRINNIVYLPKEDELNLNKNRISNTGLENIARDESRGYIDNKNNAHILKQGESLKYIGFVEKNGKKYATVNIVNKTTNKDNLDDGKENIISTGFVEISDADKGLLGSLQLFYDNNLYSNFEESLSLNKSLVYQVLDKQLLIKIKIMSQDLESNSGLYNVLIKTDNTDNWTMFQRNILNASGGIMFIQNLINQAKANGVKDVESFFKAANLK